MAFARVNSATTTGAQTSLPATSLTAGNLIVVAIRNVGAVTAPTDTATNTYLLAPRGNSPTIGNTNLSIWYVMNCLGHASNVVTANGSLSFTRMLSAQYSTPATYSLTQAIGPNRTSVAIAEAGVMTAANGLMVLVANNDSGGGTYTEATGWTNNIEDSAAVISLADAIVSTETTLQVTITYSSAVEGNLGAVGFAEPGGGGGGGGGSFTFLG